MELCKSCSNNEICNKKAVSECEHYDVAYTRSEIMNMVVNSDTNARARLLSAIERTYKLKLSF